jgi:hypothetical protein
MVKKKQELITQKEYAKRKGVSAVAIHKHVKSGKITLIDGKIDPVKADEELRQSLDPNQDAKINIEGLNEGKNYAIITNKAKAAKMVAEAKIADLTFKNLNKEFVPVRVLDNEGFDLGRLVRDNMLGVSVRIASLCAAESDTHKVAKLIDDEIKKGLEVLEKA